MAKVHAMKGAHQNLLNVISRRQSHILSRKKATQPSMSSQLGLMQTCCPCIVQLRMPPQAGSGG